MQKKEFGGDVSLIYRKRKTKFQICQQETKKRKLNLF